MSYKCFPTEVHSSAFLQSVIFDVKNSVSSSRGVNQHALTMNPRFSSATDFPSLVQTWQTDPRSLKRRLATFAQACSYRAFPFNETFVTSGLCSLLVSHLCCPEYQNLVMRAVLNLSSLENPGDALSPAQLKNWWFQVLRHRLSDQAYDAVALRRGSLIGHTGDYWFHNSRLGQSEVT
jgi:hypothetical protein